MSLNNIPDLSLADAAPINTIHGRQRSNTSPTQPLSTNKTAPLNDASLPRPPAHAIDHYYEPPQLMRQGGRHEEQKPDLQVLTGGTHANPANPISSSPSPYSRSLKREANSPVYLDPNTISLASSNNNSYFSSRDNPNCLTRRVVQCNSDRIRSSDSDVTSISSQDENINFKQKSAEGSEDKTINVKNRKKTSGQRNKWTQEETQALVRGCNNFAIGQWKAIRDSEPQLAKRSPGDLKDRFRTYFPDAYRKHYPNAKTHISSRVRSVDSNGNPLFGENAIRRERKQFSPEEDAALKRGYVKFGTAWSSIQKDPVLASRKATDLRDRFRNAFPQIYNSSAAAGYKPRSRKASGSNVFDFLSDANQQHGTFEAIDLSVYPPHPSRVTNHLHPNQYQLPSLDFLKAHGADAFSEFSKMLSNPHVPIGEDIGSLENPQLLATRINSAIPAHLTNTTPRPNITTPRPNDTTPRPRKSLATTTAEDLEAASGGSCKQTFHSRVPVPTKPPKSLHKTQSSMDLTQFSNLHLVDTGLNLATIPHHIPADPHQIPSDPHHTQPSMYSPTHTDYLEYGASGTAQRLDNHFFQSLAAKLSLGPGGNHGDSGGNLELTESPVMGQYVHDFKAATGMNENSDWLRELEVASQTFPGAFDFSGCTTNGKMFESPEGGSSGSSLISSDPSKDSFDDRVVYTGDANHFHQSSPTCHSFTSQPALPQHQSLVHSMSTLAPQTQEFFLNGQFMENNHNLILEQLPNQEARMSMDRGPTNLHPCQLEQAGRMYQHHHHAELMNNEHLNQITLCPPLLASDLNSPLPCSPTSSASASSAIHPSSSTSSLSAISSPVTNQLDLLNM